MPIRKKSGNLFNDPCTSAFCGHWMQSRKPTMSYGGYVGMAKEGKLKESTQFVDMIIIIISYGNINRFNVC